jgi:TetR/AcrR family fatty acid metabolism transcriptional regulator
MRGRKKSDETRLAIVNCAAEVFAQQDFHEVLTDDIAHRLGIGKGTIYRYFRSKEELYLAAIGEGLSGLRATVERAIEDNKDLRPTIEGLAGTLISYFWRRRDFFVLLHRLEAKLSEEERTDWQKSRDEVVAMVARRLDQAVAAGEINRVDARLAVEALFGMIRGVCVYRGENDRPEEITRLVTDIFLRGLGEGADPSASTGKLKVVKGGSPRS